MGKICALIVAAGKGTRMGSKVSKQFLKLKNKPVLYYTLKTFEECKYIDEIILVLSAEEIKYCTDEIVNKYNIRKVKKIVVGGNERQDSVFYGLKAMDECEVVLIHDGARPFVTEDVIHSGIKYAREYGACSCGVKPKDTIKIKDSNGFSIATPERDSLFSVQTPQCFKYDIIYQCHLRLREESIKVTDDTMLVERYGNKVYLYEGNYRNIKITTPEDMLIAETIVSAVEDMGK